MTYCIVKRNFFLSASSCCSISKEQLEKVAQSNIQTVMKEEVYVHGSAYLFVMQKHSFDKVAVQESQMKESILFVAVFDNWNTLIAFLAAL